MRKPRLITIPISHCCEKARWALEYCGIPYQEERHLQGFHMLHAWRIARSDEVPILRTAEGVLTDSTDILRWAESRSTNGHRLYPNEAAASLEDQLDEEFGVTGRLWMYTYMLNEIPTLIRYSRIAGVPSVETALMPLIFPFAKPRILRWLDVTPTSREDSRAAVDRIFGRIAELLRDGRRFLAGDSFSAADLTFAALSAPVVIPERYGVRLPSLDELPASMSDQVRVWREHPAGQFELRNYREFR